jgi:hypothetical protein
MKANPTTDSNKDISRKRTKYDRQPKNNQLEPSKHLIAKIERERDYYHTCIYSQY